MFSPFKSAGAGPDDRARGVIDSRRAPESARAHHLSSDPAERPQLASGRSVREGALPPEKVAHRLLNAGYLPAEVQGQLRSANLRAVPTSVSADMKCAEEGKQPERRDGLR